MARPISEQELQLKKRARRRLVGAIVLVTAVAVVLPMVLDSEPKPVSQNVEIHIPSPDSGEFKSKAPLPPQSPGAGNDTAKQKADAGTPTGDASPASSGPAQAAERPASVEVPPVLVQGGDSGGLPKSAERKETASAPAFAEKSQARSATEKSQTVVTEKSKSAAVNDKPKPTAATENAKSPAGGDGKQKMAGSTAKSKPAAETPKVPPPSDSPRRAAESTPVSGAYVVQVAALSDESKAKRLQKQMSGAGVKAYTEIVATKTGDVTRVRAGPFATREAAEKAQAQLKKAGLDGRVVQR